VRCNKCHLESEDFSLFCKDKTRKSGYKNWCKECIKLIGLEYRKNNLDKIKARCKERYKRDKNKYSSLNRRLKDPIKYRAWEIRHGVVNRKRLNGIEYDKDIFNSKLLEKKLRELETCPCCGCSFKFLSNDGNRNMRTPSVDRIDSTKGYIEGNITFICCKCNLMKNDASIEDLEKLILWLRSRSD